MITQSQPRKVFQGIATRQQMFHLFDRHAQSPMSKARYTGRLHDGEWFEIGRAEHDYMFEILPPLWMRGDAFAMREFMAGSITSVFFTLSIDGRMRYFHAYCDMTARGSVDAMRRAILDRESIPVPPISRTEQLEHIWSTTRPIIAAMPATAGAKLPAASAPSLSWMIRGARSSRCSKI